MSLGDKLLECGVPYNDLAFGRVLAFQDGRTGQHVLLMSSAEAGRYDLAKIGSLGLIVRMCSHEESPDVMDIPEILESRTAVFQHLQTDAVTSTTAALAVTALGVIVIANSEKEVKILAKHYAEALTSGGLPGMPITVLEGVGQVIVNGLAGHLVEEIDLDDTPAGITVEDISSLVSMLDSVKSVDEFLSKI